MIHVSDDIGDAGEFNWQLLICLFCAWVITYLCLFRGIKSSGKVCMYFPMFREPIFYVYCGTTGVIVVRLPNNMDKLWTVQ